MSEQHAGHYVLDCSKEAHMQIVEFLAEKAKATEGTPCKIEIRIRLRELLAE